MTFGDQASLQGPTLRDHPVQGGAPEFTGTPQRLVDRKHRGKHVIRRRRSEAKLFCSDVVELLAAVGSSRVFEINVLQIGRLLLGLAAAAFAEVESCLRHSTFL
jgi:hypothetical protein